MQGLARAGLVNSQRGPHGGFTLRKPPTELSVLDIVDAIDPLARITECPLDLDAHCEQLCPLHRRLDEAAAQVEAAFRATSIAELLADPSPARMLGS
jgi:Rrf2 family protein